MRTCLCAAIHGITAKEKFYVGQKTFAAGVILVNCRIYKAMASRAAGIVNGALGPVAPKIQFFGFPIKYGCATIVPTYGNTFREARALHSNNTVLVDDDQVYPSTEVCMAFSVNTPPATHRVADHANALHTPLTPLVAPIHFMTFGDMALRTENEPEPPAIH